MMGGSNPSTLFAPTPLIPYNIPLKYAALVMMVRAPCVIQKSGFTEVGFLSCTRYYIFKTRITTNLSHRNDVNYL